MKPGFSRPGLRLGSRTRGPLAGHHTAELAAGPEESSSFWLLWLPGHSGHPEPGAGSGAGSAI